MRKNRLLSLLMAAAMMAMAALTLSSCKSDENNENSEKPAPSKYDVTGTWMAEVEAAGTVGGGGQMTYDHLVTACKFNTDGSGTWYRFMLTNDSGNPVAVDGGAGHGDFTYSVSDDGKIACRLTGSQAPAYYPASLALTLSGDTIAGREGDVDYKMSRASDAMARWIANWDQRLHGGGNSDATTGDIVAGSETALVSGGTATGGTMMYKVTTANTKPTSTEGFSATVPTAKTLAAGTFYVWYYVKADATHTDSEISASGIEVTIAAAAPATITVTWNNDDITGSGNSFTKDGVTITAGNIDFGEKNFMNGGTFTTTLGNFTKIEVTTGFWDASGTGWSGSGQSATWTGTPASSVSFSGDIMGMGGMMGTTKFVFTIEPTN